MTRLLILAGLAALVIACSGAAVTVTITAPTVYDDGACQPGTEPLAADSLGPTIVEGAAVETGLWSLWASYDLAPGEVKSHTQTVPLPGQRWYVRVTALSMSGQGCPAVIQKIASGRPAAAGVR